MKAVALPKESSSCKNKTATCICQTIKHTSVCLIIAAAKNRFFIDIDKYHEQDTSYSSGRTNVSRLVINNAADKKNSRLPNTYFLSMLLTVIGDS